jgi:hypothetical protein
MKTKIFSLIALSSLVIFITNSCCEVDVLTKSTAEVALLDTTYIASSIEATTPKVVVIEEFTGVRCINCAPGHVEAKTIKNANPGRVVTLAMHSRFLDEPYPFSFHELTSDDAQAISNFIGPVGSKPTASIDRKLFSGEASKILDKTKWTTKVNEQLALTSPVNINLTSDFRASDTTTLVTFTAHFTQAFSDPLKFTIMLVENDLVTAQLLPTNSVDTNYVHEDVMRDITTDIEGTSLGTASITPGRVFIKQYRLKIDHEWHADDMHVVAFIHRTGTSYEILQASEISLK